MHLKTVLSSPERGDVVLRPADHTVRMVVPDQAEFRFGIRGDKTVMRRCAEKFGLHANFRRARSGPGSESPNCVVIFSPATKALKRIIKETKELDELIQRCIDAVEEFLTKRPKAVAAPKVQRTKAAKRSPLSQQRLAALVASG